MAKLLLIGWDAADWKIINHLIEKGQMPSVESLINQGCMGNLSTLEPPFSPMLWTSIATGKLADKHGILGFTEPDPNGNGVRAVTSTSRKTKAIWNILMQNGLKTNVIGWWPSHPTEPINGVMVSNHFHQVGNTIQKSMPNSVHPQNLTELFEYLKVYPNEFNQNHILPFVPSATKEVFEKDQRIGTIAKLLAEATNIQSIATWTLDNTEWDFTGVYFDAIDHFSHAFMNYVPPKLDRITEKDFELYNEVVYSAYRYHDMILGTLLEKITPDTTVILMSDHGFHSDHLRPQNMSYEPAGVAQQHRSQGVFVIKGPGIKKDELVHGASLLNITPTILSIFGLPSGKDMDGFPLIQIFEEPNLPPMIDSWDSINGDCGRHNKEVQMDPVLAQQALMQLVELGYIESPSDNLVENAKVAEMEQKYNLARLYVGSNRQSLAIPLFEELWQWNKSEGRFANRLARCYINSGNYTKAKQLLDEYDTISPKYQLSKEEIELINKRSKEENKKESYESKKIQQQIRKHQDINYWTRQNEFINGEILLAQNKLQEAEEHFKKLHKANPNSLDLLLKLAHLASSQNKFEKAEQLYNQILFKNPHSEIALASLASLFISTKKYDQATEKALDSLALNYFQPQTHYILGEALIGLNNYQDAATAYDVALKMVPNFGLARQKLIALYENQLKNPELANELTNYFNVKADSELTKNFSPEKQFETAIYHTKNIKLDNPIIIVSGLPRSGTSVMMQMLAQGGFPIFTDNLRTADESNKKGYYEHEAVKSLARNNKWVDETTGKVVKVVAPLLHHLPPRHNYKVIFMLRDLEEIISSQHQMLIRNGKHKSNSYPAGLHLVYTNHLETSKKWMSEMHNVDVMYVNYNDVINNSVDIAQKIIDFLDVEMEVQKITSIIDKSLYRERKIEK